jgi:signal transduction histidine kinase
VINKLFKWAGLILASLFLLTVKTLAQTQPDTLFIKNHQSYDITKHLYHFSTPVFKSLNDISKLLNTNSFKKLYPNHTINDKATKNFYWLTFTLKNQQDTDDVFYLQLHQPWLKLAKMYRKTDRGFVLIGRSGMKLNFGARPYSHYDIVFPLALHNESYSTYLVFIDNRGYNLNILPTLKGDQAFSTEEKKEYMFLGIFTGVMFFSILINIFLYLSLKEKIHLLYAQYVLSMMYWMYCSISFDFQYLYPNLPSFAYISEYIASGLALITMANLITSFLQVTPGNSRFKWAMDFLKYFFFLLIIACLVINYWFGNDIALKVLFLRIFVGAVILLTILFYVIAIEKIFQKVALAWLYVIGGAFLIFGVIKHCIYILSGNLNSSMQSIPNDSQIGLAFEAIVIFMGIVYRYNLYKDEKEKLLLQLTLNQKETLQKIVAAQEDERKRIAQDIHDDVGSTLGTLMLHISNVPENRNPTETEAHYKKSIDIGRKAINDLRSISHDLLPKDFAERGIFYILKKRVDELNIISNIRFTLIIEGDDQSIENIFSITIYRIINELINNTLKHSQANLATIQLLITDTEILVILEDNGIGGSTAKGTKGIGMKNIYSRTEFLNGKINIDDSPAGTSVIIEIPIET